VTLHTIRIAIIAGVLAMPAVAAEPSPVEPLVKAVAKEGADNREAALAWRSLVDAGPKSLVPLFTALDTASPAAANWIATGIDAILENEKKAGRELPVAELEAFLKDTSHSPRGRRMAFEIITTAVPAKKDTLLAGMINDPSVELRRDAIARGIENAKKISAAPTAKKLYMEMFEAARDLDQIEELAKQCKMFGGEVSVTAHLNFITEWQWIGPFDNAEGAGFARKFDPETAVDLTAQYPDKSGKAVPWKPVATDDKFGTVDLNKAAGKVKAAVVFAFAAVESEKERPVEIRVGSANAITIYLNGEKIFAKEEYHHGARMDQYVGKGKLKAGRNEVLIKVCQNEQTEPWAQKWEFQARICDATGGKVPFKIIK